VLHGAHQDAVGLLGCLDHRLGFVGPARQRALAQHVLAGFECRDRHRRVQVVRGADVDRVDVVGFEQVVEPIAGPLDLELLRDPVGLLGIAVDQSDQIHALHLLQGGDVIDLGRTTDSDQSDAKVFARHAHAPP